MKILYLIPGPKEGNSFIFSKREIKALIKNEGVEVLPFFFDTKSRGSFIGELLNLRRMIIQKEIDIIHAQYGSITAILACLVSRNKKVVITFRGSDINGSADVGYFRRKFSIILSYISLVFSDGCIFVSDSLRKASPHLYKTSAIVPSGVDIEEFRPEDKFKCREDLKLKPDKKYALFFSSYDSKNKRIDLATQAMKEIRNKGYDSFELLIMDGTVSSSLMPAYMNASDVVLMLSDKEGSPTVVQEALAVGTPIVAVQVGDTDEMLQGVVNARLVERDPQAIATAMLEVTAIGKISPEEVILDRFNFECCVEKIVDFYKKLQA